MTNRKIKTGFFLFLISILNYFPVFSQVNIAGPKCVVPGTIYQYVISGKWDSTSTMQVCVSGGTIASKTVNCTSNSKPLSYVQVIWNKGTTGSIQVNSSSGNTNFPVAFSEMLVGGSIQDSSKTSAINYNDKPSIIHCSASSGGSCSPQFSYQWQQSTDAVSWVDIAGAQSQDLVFSSSYKKTTFFRRKVTETTSGSIAYSEFATIYVAAPPPTAMNNKSNTNGNEDMAINFPMNNIKIF
jgi:hypothetical protein